MRDAEHIDKVFSGFDIKHQEQEKYKWIMSFSSIALNVSIKT